MPDSKPSSNNNLSSGLSEVLRKHRVQLGLSQMQLAERAGLHRSYISEVERRAQNVTIETLGKLADALETSVLNLIEQATENAKHLTRPIEILLVEDNEADIYMMGHSLKALKMCTQLHVVRDGKQAMEFLYQRGEHKDAPVPDLVLLDLHIPKKNGQQVLAEMKSDPRFKQVPVVVLTTSSNDSDVEKCYDLLANSFITKPMTQREFENAIAVMMDYWFGVAKVPPGKTEKKSEDNQEARTL